MANKVYASTTAITALWAKIKEKLNLKVDKVDGKGLSTNDYTTTEKNKLSGIAAGAEVNVQSDWNQTTTTADDFIKNKPSIPQASSTIPTMNGTGAVGTGTTWARADHVHPSDTSKVSKSGNETISGTKTFSGAISITRNSSFSSSTGDVIEPNPSAIIQSPIPKYLWHDILAFCRAATPIYYTTANGTTWTESALEKNLFAHKEAWGTTTILSSTIAGSRWVWPASAGFYASQGAWLVIGIAYVNPYSYFDLLFETSSDSGQTWTTLVQATGLHYVQKPIWIRTSGTVQNSLRLTITNNSQSDSTASLRLTTIRFLTYRWGDQGKGSEFEMPIRWDGNGNVTAIPGGSITATSASTVNSHTVNSDVPSNAKFTDTTYALSISGSRITLTPDSGTSSYIDLPIYDGSVR